MNARTACALLLGAAFLSLLFAAIAPAAGPWPAGLPPAAGAGTALWMDRTFEVLLQGLIILAGVVSILLLLGSRKSREGSP